MLPIEQALQLVEAFIADCEDLGLEEIVRRMDELTAIISHDLTSVRERLTLLDAILSRLRVINDISWQKQDCLAGFIAPCTMLALLISRDVPPERFNQLMRNVNEFMFFRDQDVAGGTQGEWVIGSIAFHMLGILSGDTPLARALERPRPYQVSFSTMRYHVGYVAIEFAPQGERPIKFGLQEQLLPLKISYPRLADLEKDVKFRRFFSLVTDRLLLGGSADDYRRRAKTFLGQLEHDRRYALTGFDRVRLTSLPELEELKTFINFVERGPDQPLLVEFEVKGRRVILEMNRQTGELAWPNWGLTGLEDMFDRKVFKRLKPFNWQFVPRAVRPRLELLAAQYLYELLSARLARYVPVSEVEPESVISRPSPGSSFDRPSLGEIAWERVETIPRQLAPPPLSGGARPSGRGRCSPLRHLVRGHLRRLGANQTASQEALAEAAPAGLFVPPGFTFVRKYERGEGLGQERHYEPKE